MERYEIQCHHKRIAAVRTEKCHVLVFFLLRIDSLLVFVRVMALQATLKKKTDKSKTKITKSSILTLYHEMYEELLDRLNRGMEDAKALIGAGCPAQLLVESLKESYPMTAIQVEEEKLVKNGLTHEEVVKGVEKFEKDAEVEQLLTSITDMHIKFDELKKIPTGKLPEHVTKEFILDFIKKGFEMQLQNTKEFFAKVKESAARRIVAEVDGKQVKEIEHTNKESLAALPASTADSVVEKVAGNAKKSSELVSTGNVSDKSEVVADTKIAQEKSLLDDYLENSKVLEETMVKLQEEQLAQANITPVQHSAAMIAFAGEKDFSEKYNQLKQEQTERSIQVHADFFGLTPEQLVQQLEYLRRRREVEEAVLILRNAGKSDAEIVTILKQLNDDEAARSKAAASATMPQLSSNAPEKKKKKKHSKKKKAEKTSAGAEEAPITGQLQDLD